MRGPRVVIRCVSRAEGAAKMMRRVGVRRWRVLTVGEEEYECGVEGGEGGGEEVGEDGRGGARGVDYLCDGVERGADHRCDRGLNLHGLYTN